MDLSLKEKFLIISIEPGKGKIMLMGNQLTYGIAGAILLELKSKNIVNFADNILILNQYRPSVDRIINRAVEIIRKSKRKRRVNIWLMRFSWRGNSFVREILRKLMSHNIIRKERKRFLNIIPYNRYFFLQKNVRNQTISSLKDALYTKSITSQNEDLNLLGLIHACGLERIFTDDKNEKKELARYLKEQINTNDAFAEIKPLIKKIKTAIATSRSSPVTV